MAENRITLTYVNIRQSIIILLTKVLLLDFVMIAVIIGAYFVLIQGGQFTAFATKNMVVFLVAIGFTGLVKVAASVYIILMWLNEYYEITPTNIVHKSGIIFRKTEIYDLDKIRIMEIEDTFLGELFNYATITLYDIRLNKYLEMYLIHNPQRYAKILKTLKPSLEMKKDRVHLPFMPFEAALGEEYSIDV